MCNTKIITTIIITSDKEKFHKLIICVEIKNNLKEYFIFLSKLNAEKRINNNVINLPRLNLTNLHSHAQNFLLSFLLLINVNPQKYSTPISKQMSVRLSINRQFLD